MIRVLEWVKLVAWLLWILGWFAFGVILGLLFLAMVALILIFMVLL